MAESEFIGADDVDLRQLGPGEVLCDAGERLDVVYQLRSGQLEVVHESDSGPVVITELSEPSLVGEISAVAGGLTTAQVRASSDVTVAVISLDQFDAWLKANPESASRIADRARRNAERTRAISVLSALLGAGHADAIHAIASELSVLNLSAGEVLFEQGDDADAAYIVITGRVQVRGTTRTGEVFIDETFGQRALIGELGLIDQEPRSASVTAVRDSTLAVLDQAAYEQLTTRHPAVMMRLLYSIVRRRQSTPFSRDRGSRAVTVLFAASGDANDTRRRKWMRDFVAETSRHGAVAELSPGIVDTYLGRQGLAAAASGTVGHARLAEFLHDAEAQHDYLVFEGDLDLDVWTLRAMRHSDRVVIVTSAHPDAEERERLDRCLALADGQRRPDVTVVRTYKSGTQPFGAGALLDDSRVDDVLHAREEVERDTTRAARLCTGNANALVLSGGGARGFGHIGVMRAFEELGVDIDILVGASIGSVMAAAASLGHDAKTIETMVTEFFHDLLDYTLPVVALLRSKRITANINTVLGPWMVENTWIPFACVSTNLTSPGRVTHRTGSLSTAVRASVAIPGVLPPVAVNGELLVDGGVIDNLPVDVAADDERVGTVIAVDLAPPDSPPFRIDFAPDVSGLAALRARITPGEQNFPTLGSTLMRSMLVAAAERRDEQMQHESIDLCISLDLPDFGLLDFEKVPEGAEAGYWSAKPQIEQWLTASAES